MFTSSKKTFSVLQSRIYNIHVPRKVVFGVNIIKKLLKLSITRPTVNNPAQSRMHAQTIVTAKNNKIGEATSEYGEVLGVRFDSLGSGYTEPMYIYFPGGGGTGGDGGDSAPTATSHPGGHLLIDWRLGNLPNGRDLCEPAVWPRSSIVDLSRRGDGSQGIYKRCVVE